MEKTGFDTGWLITLIVDFLDYLCWDAGGNDIVRNIRVYKAASTDN
jgi:hypothetical protein